MNKSSFDAWQIVEKEYPEIADVISGSIDRLLETVKLDNKTKQLIYIAVQTAVNYPLAVKYHVPEALAAGATRDEIISAAAIASAAAGPKGFVRSFPTILETIHIHNTKKGII